MVWGGEFKEYYQHCARVDRVRHSVILAQLDSTLDGHGVVPVADDRETPIGKPISIQLIVYFGPTVSSIHHCQHSRLPASHYLLHRENKVANGFPFLTGVYTLLRLSKQPLAVLTIITSISSHFLLADQ